ncbi:ribosomal protein S18-alanine N-acetyltransferase [Shewanella benthica]|uniref:ribosomal protein S18-alanine N-acetyltransferase n=1 Tax=Shewanella benthica TaxID=43661 RepID=UPI00187A4291|nr:ribosomal protein S18-alanine N-acetyltransferase [Shewanella benthica]MBE7216683.1 ribosomal protein S18-alanine N-acetyltransferase [Shewanella benthica]MCL1064813.1 ribosomal protein S18-alanine N-acetyltransferase [Shewanella benthica]
MSHQVCSLSLTDAVNMAKLAALAHSHPMSLRTIESCFGSLYSTFGLEVEGDLVGFAILHQIFEDATLMDICVDPSKQGRGYGQMLLQAVIANAVQSKAETLFLEVRSSSLAARHLYSKYDFKESGIRQSYYKTENGNEDAILMELAIN